MYTSWQRVDARACTYKAGSITRYKRSAIGHRLARRQWRNLRGMRRTSLLSMHRSVLQQDYYDVCRLECCCWDKGNVRDLTNVVCLILLQTLSLSLSLYNTLDIFIYSTIYTREIYTHNRETRINCFIYKALFIKISWISLTIWFGNNDWILMSQHTFTWRVALFPTSLGGESRESPAKDGTALETRRTKKDSFGRKHGGNRYAKGSVTNELYSQMLYSVGPPVPF